MNLKHQKKLGRVVKVGDVNVWNHEDFIASAFSRLGFSVTFYPAHNSITSADAYINRTLFEFKSPDGNRIKCVDNNLKKALKNQSKCIVICSIRLKNVTDRSVENHLREVITKRPDIRRLYFVDKHGRVIDIKNPL